LSPKLTLWMASEREELQKTKVDSERALLGFYEVKLAQNKKNKNKT